MPAGPAHRFVDVDRCRERIRKSYHPMVAARFKSAPRDHRNDRVEVRSLRHHRLDPDRATLDGLANGQRIGGPTFSKPG